MGYREGTVGTTAACVRKVGSDRGLVTLVIVMFKFMLVEKTCSQIKNNILRSLTMTFDDAGGTLLTR